MRDLAGLGDLSTIIDRSSISLSSPRNPYDDVLRTPLKPRTPISDKATPTPLTRNLFARNRPPSISPSKPPSVRSSYKPPNTVVLPESRRSLGRWSPSPDEEDERETTPTPVVHRIINGNRRAVNGGQSPEIKPKHEPSTAKAPEEAAVGVLLPPPQQIPSNHSSNSTSGDVGLPNGKTVAFESTLLNEPRKRSLPSPTVVDPGLLEVSSSVTQVNGTVYPAKVRKRVRMASPTQLNHPNGSGQTQISSNGGSSKSQTSAQTDTTGSDLTVPALLSSTAWQFSKPPPWSREVGASMEGNGVPSVVYQEPYYSSPLDVPLRAKMFAGRMFSLKGNVVGDLQDFEHQTSSSRSWLKRKKLELESAKHGWEMAMPPPSRRIVVEWCRKLDEEAATQSTSSLCKSGHALLIFTSRATGTTHLTTRQADPEKQVRLQVLPEKEDQRLGT